MFVLAMKAERFEDLTFMAFFWREDGRPEGLF